jgi:hypothetical protein
VGLKLNGTHQLLAYADDVNLLEDNIDTVKRNTGTLIDASEEVGLEENIEKTKYMLVSCDQNADHNWDIKIGNRSFENVSYFKYLGMAVTNQNLILRRTVRGDWLLAMIATTQSKTFHLLICLLETVKIRIKKTIILPVSIWV